jgi:NhaC family Na+:H+ antiporter
MLWTTVPSIGIALLLFAIIGATSAVPSDTAAIEAIQRDLGAQFSLGLHLMIPVLLVLALVVGKVPAFPALLIGALVGCLFAVLFQQQAVVAYVGESDLPRSLVLVKGAWMSLFDG